MAEVEITFPIRRQPAARVFRERKHLDDMRDGDILDRYRFSREGIEYLTDEFQPILERNTMRSSAIPVLTQVLIGLRYLAKGDLLSEVGDNHGVSRSSACRIIDRFVDGVNDHFDNIRFPTHITLNIVKHEFYLKCGIPNVIGAVDGTLIPIVAPSTDEPLFVCRKGYHCQAVVDHEGSSVAWLYTRLFSL